MVGFGLAGAACSLAPDYAPPAVTVAPAFKESGLWVQAQPSDAGPRSAWWTAFQDPVLDDLEGRVNTANPTLAAALAAYDQARALAGEVNANLVPTVTAVGSPTYNRQSDHRPLRGAGQPDEYAANTLGAQIDYEFDFWGRIRNQIAAVGAQAQASAADLVDKI
jgi:outer membrane protein TolC